VRWCRLENVSWLMCGVEGYEIWRAMCNARCEALWAKCARRGDMGEMCPAQQSYEFSNSTVKSKSHQAEILWKISIGSILPTHYFVLFGKTLCN
jgi:hypothetical protein